MSIDTIGNFLTIIRNGIKVTKTSVRAPYSKMCQDIAHILKEEGFIKDCVVVEEDSKKNLKVFLKYVDGESVIHEISRVSTPGLRVYNKIKQVPPVIGGLGVSILSTNKGILSDKTAEKLNVGGEVMCRVW